MNHLTAETHSKLDADLVPILSHIPFDTEADTILCIVLAKCAPSYAVVHWPVRIFDFVAYSEILDRDQGVRDLLRQAHKRGQYTEIRNLHEWQFLRFVPPNT
jgi:hypothetical protein